ncbi:MAG: S46 family peptidase [Aureliella sp.]
MMLAAVADEGMYPISSIGQLDLNRKGLAIAPEEIFNPNETCLVDGICRVNGCTGSFVSPSGLIITNHHCAYGALQSASTPQRDYLADGFQAHTRAEEVIAKGYTVRITESYSDVSQQVLSVVTPEMSFLERTKAIERRCKELEKQAEVAAPGKRAEVAEMFAGKTYVLFLYTYLKDVRLVFAPPASIGNFGGEVDNWEWPRHTGDFSFLRAYTAPDGSSADYSPNNVPYRPKRFIQVASQGVDEGDFVFLLGYPGTTSRHKTASFLRYEQDVRLPFIVELYNWQIATMEAAGRDDRAVAIKLAARMRGLANVEKRSRGQLKGLRRAAIVAQRQREEADLMKFIRSDRERNARYGSVLAEIDSVYQSMTDAAAYELTLDHLHSASRSLAIAFVLFDAASERLKDDLEREDAYMDRNFDQTIKSLMLVVDDLHLPTDKIMLGGMLERLSRIEKARQLPPLAAVLSSPDKLKTVDQWLDKTRLGEPEFVQQCLEMSPDQLLQTDDPLLKFIAELYPTYLELRQLDKARSGQLDKSYGQLVEIKQQFLSRDFVPDANGTLRLTYGRIRGYSPEDGVVKTPITTLKGVIDKATGQEPFVLPERVRQLYEAKDFGRFVHPRLGQVPVAILYDTDTTGGNSGSPVMNAKGQLVGVNFDRAFEATINDFAWNESYSRSIGVDIRYCLWLTSKVYGAGHLLEEMGVAAE